jgi:hypothetical protein
MVYYTKEGKVMANDTYFYDTYIKDKMNETISILLPPSERVVQINVSGKGGPCYV